MEELYTKNLIKTNGKYDPETGNVCISRNMLDSIESFSGILIQQISYMNVTTIHGLYNGNAFNNAFKDEITHMTGKIIGQLL